MIFTSYQQFLKNAMKKTILILLLCFINYVSFSQQKRNYKIYQFAENDSINGHISKIVKFNNENLVIYEETIDFKFSRLSAITDYVENNYYKDSLLIKTETSYRNSIKKQIVEFDYNNKNYLEKKIVKSYETRLKKNEKHEDCLLDDEDFEKKPTWKIITEEKLIYNSRGQKTEKIVDEKEFNRKKKYLYFYNYDGLLTKIKLLEDDEIIWEEFRECFEKGNYDYIRLWKNEYTFKDICRSIGKIRFVYDEKNLLIEMTKPDETGIRGNVKIQNYYNQNNELIKQERYNTENKLEITHLYLYE
jgi:hypothetical protein